GAAYCNRCGTAALSVLRNYCLMCGYGSSAINDPLIFTQALHKGAEKSLSDTVDFWMNVPAINGLLPKQACLYAILTTRLIHSYSRVRIVNSTDWYSALWGSLINLWDVMATNIGFSIASLIRMATLKLPASNEALPAALH